ncbi:MAG TPA: molybdate ABC transporter substrate-binding protein [Pyrinomonadaceae bacterium]|nr:molybdate ABC transporter substrate-binding protein [Pyrinomonadaceae bacterium]
MMTRRMLAKIRTCVAALCVAALASGVSCSRGEGGRGGGPEGEVVVAAASSLSEAFEEMGRRYTEAKGVRVTFSFGATGDLARQIEQGAPFDLFASADLKTADALGEKNLLLEPRPRVFAVGRLVLWVPNDSRAKLAAVADVAGPQVTKVAVASPDVAPYGRAAVESLRASGLWERVEPKVVYSQTVAQAKQFAATGNAEAAFVPRALARAGDGTAFEVDPATHAPVEHALAVVAASKNIGRAKEFVSFVLSEEGRAVLARHGYGAP